MMNGLFFRADGCYQKIDFASILYVEASGNYSKIVTPGKTWLVLTSLVQIGKALPREDFCRIHRGFLVNTTRITTFDNHHVRLGEQRLPIGRAYICRFFAQMPIVVQSDGVQGPAPLRRRKKVLAALAKTGAAGG
jgi:DNA-binding LytR/AlgR family response regulator